jgi:hypothetical protein
MSNQGSSPTAARVVFRVTGKAPELWDAVTGEIRALPEHNATPDGRTEVPMRFAPRQSFFVVFGEEIRKPDTRNQKPEAVVLNFPECVSAQELGGPWTVQFDAKWCYPNSGSGEAFRFDRLEDWTRRSEEAIRHYSGIATYRTSFEFQSATTPRKTFLDLGTVLNLARVRLNGQETGIVWTAPWRVDIGKALKPGRNDLEIEVANLWPNRLIGDAVLPNEQRRTVTNVRTYDTMTGNTWSCKKCEERKKSGKPAELLPSGLLGPVRVMTEP